MEERLTPESSALLVARWREGDQQAAATLWRRYAVRLIALVRRRLSGRLAAAVDPEDVVQSAYGRFFTGARADRYVLRRSGDLWRLLVAIALHRLSHQIKRRNAGKRSLAREHEEKGALLLSREPSPAEAAALADELEQQLRGLTPAQRLIVELRLEGYQMAEIAERTRHHERTVRRVLKGVEKRLQQRCREYAGE